jgi:ubiquinone/menaquinone biosynthesis C-methylase UbiE
MDISSHLRHELSGTYIIPTRFKDEELNRLLIHDQVINDGMGGVLPEQPDPARLRRVLDVGCGTGGWLIQTAQTYPTIPQLMGIDFNPHVIAYAQEQVEQLKLGERVEFRVMDVLRILDRPLDYFDLINLRRGGTYLRTWDWPKVLLELQYMTRPGGVIRVTETDMVGSTNSEAFNRMNELLVQTFYQAGYLFAQDRNGLLNELPRLFQQHGIRNVQTRSHTLEFHGDTPAGQAFSEGAILGMRVTMPFIQKWTRLPDDFEAISQQAFADMQEPDFVATWKMLTVWGTRESL